MIAKSVFAALGAQTVVVGAEPDGLNVNENCGSTHIENLSRLVKEQHLDVGFAFDGDADRCIAVDGNGNVVDGDKILFILGKRLKSRGMLSDDTVVATVMSNSGFFASLKKAGIECEQTKVGDRFVYESMINNDFSLGGEQSGHVICLDYSTTGDGQLTGAQLMSLLNRRKAKLSSIATLMERYPQVLINVKVSNENKPRFATDEVINEKMKSVENILKGRHTDTELLCYRHLVRYLVPDTLDAAIFNVLCSIA